MPRLTLRRLIVVLLGLVGPFAAQCGPGYKPIAREGQVELPDGNRVFYRLVGGGIDTLVAIPGGPAWSSRYLEEALLPLARSHALLLYDPPGRGRSSAMPADRLSMAGDVAALEAVRAHFGIGAMKLLGHHYGAGVALLYATLHPARVERVIFASPMPRQSSFVWRLALARSDSAALTRYQRAAADRLTDPMRFCRSFWGWDLSPAEEVEPQVVRRLAPLICDATPDRLRERDSLSRSIMRTNPGWQWADSLARLDRPALVIVGSRTPVLATLAESWALPATDARLLRLEGSSWFPWVDHPGTWISGVDRFLSGQWPDSALIVREPPQAAADTLRGT